MHRVYRKCSRNASEDENNDIDDDKNNVSLHCRNSLENYSGERPLLKFIHIFI